MANDWPGLRRRVTLALRNRIIVLNVFGLIQLAPEPAAMFIRILQIHTDSTTLHDVAATRPARLSWRLSLGDAETVEMSLLGRLTHF